MSSGIAPAPRLAAAQAATEISLAHTLSESRSVVISWAGFACPAYPSAGRGSTNGQAHGRGNQAVSPDRRGGLLGHRLGQQGVRVLASPLRLGPGACS